MTTVDPGRHHLGDAEDGWEDRPQPHDRGAEMCTLGGMMLSRDALGEVADILVGSDFYWHQHATIYNTILWLSNSGEPADAYTVAAALQDSGDLGRVGGAPYLHTLISSVPTAANAAHYARIVAERSELRRIIRAGTQITQIGYTGRGDLEENLADKVTQIAYEAVSGRHATADVTTMEILRETFEQIERAAAGTSAGLPTGFPDLDDVLGGLMPGQLVLIAGRPGIGKSILGMDIARHVALRLRRGVQVFNMEMLRTEIMMRILSAECRIPFHVMRLGRGLTDDDWSLMARHGAEITDSALYLDDTPGQTLTSLRTKARRRKQRGDLALVVVDYLQLMIPGKRAESQEREISEISRGLKLLAKELEVPVIAAAQLNRGPEARSDKRPQLADLRSSGSLEQDADVVILLHRDDYYDKESPRAGEVDFIVAKNRSGPTDTVTAAAQLHLMRFASMAIG